MKGWLQRIREQIGGVALTLLALALLAVTVHVVVFQGERREAVVLSERLNRIRQEISRLSRENERLRHLIVNIRHTDDQVIKIGREDFGYIKAGEVLYHFEKPAPARQSMPAEPSTPASTPRGKSGNAPGAEPAPGSGSTGDVPTGKVAPKAAGIIPEALSDQLRP